VTERVTYIYRVSIKSFPDYKHLLQENYVEYKNIFLPLLKLVVKKFLDLSYIKKNMFVFHVVFFVINVCNQEKTLCSPCRFRKGGASFKVF